MIQFTLSHKPFRPIAVLTLLRRHCFRAPTRPLDYRVTVPSRPGPLGPIYNSRSSQSHRYSPLRPQAVLRKQLFHHSTSTMSLINPIDTEQYNLGVLSEDTIAESPESQFQIWFDEAREKGVPMPEAVNLATAELPSGRVSNRTVLMKELDTKGNVVIYSNWETSRKANDFKTNPWVSLTFYWKELERQVRVEGKANRLTAEESQPYFDSRPRGSRIGAWASQQSRPVTNRDELENQVSEIEKKFEGQEKFSVPPFWGGIRVVPVHWEFWQGRRNRVHDRLVFDKEDGKWVRSRLSP